MLTDASKNIKICDSIFNVINIVVFAIFRAKEQYIKQRNWTMNDLLKVFFKIK